MIYKESVMKKQFLVLSMAALALTACDQAEKRHEPPRGSSEVSYDINAEELKSNDQLYDANNMEMGRTSRDMRSNPSRTPFDPSANTADRDITKRIRQSLIADDSLSTNAKNVKIITERQGFVTLRGSVNNEREKALIANKAKDVPGVAQVDNQIEVVRR
jgi:osmotically-inducible protein OsmY